MPIVVFFTASLKAVHLCCIECQFQFLLLITHNTDSPEPFRTLILFLILLYSIFLNSISSIDLLFLVLLISSFNSKNSNKRFACSSFTKRYGLIASIREIHSSSPPTCHLYSFF